MKPTTEDMNSSNNGDGSGGHKRTESNGSEMKSVVIDSQNQNGHKRTESNGLKQNECNLGHKRCESEGKVTYSVGGKQHTLNSSASKPITGILNLYFGQKRKKNDKNEENNFKKELGTVIMMFLLLVLFLISVTGFFIMWFTEMYNDRILQNLILANGTTAVKWWKTPPVDPHLRVHIFNYTNTERWLKKLDDELHVQDMGPYVYQEKFQKVNVVFNANNTITYKEHRSYEFLPELSKGRQYDRIIFPNVVLIGAAEKTEGNFLGRLGISSVTAPLFQNVSAHELIWGYKDSLLQLKKSFSFMDTSASDRFGMLMTRNGTSAETISIFTGEDNIKKLSVIDTFNGEKKLNYWGTDECNRIDGTDGSQFPPHLMDKKHPLYVFVKAFCRKFPLVFDSEVNILDGIPAWRYKAPLDVFAHPDIKPENQCYCHIESGTCPPSGVFNASKCFEGAPILTSFPHFFTGEESLYKNLKGLKPDEKLHRSYADIHPLLAFPIGGASRFQINVQVRHSGFDATNKFENNQILPIIWVEIASGTLSSELRSTIYHSTFSATAIQLSLKYGSLFVCVILLAILVGTIYYRKKRIQELKKQNKPDKSDISVSE